MSTELTAINEIFTKFTAQAEQEASFGEGFRPPYLRIREEKVVSGKTRRDEPRVVIVDPNRLDEEGKPYEKSYEAVEGVLLAWKPYGVFQYNKVDGSERGKFTIEGFHLDTKKRGIVVGTLVDGARPRLELAESYNRDVITFSGETKFNEPVRFSSRAAAAFLLKPEYWIDPEEPLIAFAFMSSSSVYGGTEERMEEELKQYTLTAFGARGSTHKGILPTLSERPWTLPERSGHGPAAAKTPKAAIWLNIYGEKLGTPVPVHAFDFDREGHESELTQDELMMVNQHQLEGEQMLIKWAANEYTRALPALSERQAEVIAELAYHGKLAELSAQISATIPEVLPPARSVNSNATTAHVEDDDTIGEFPPEEDLPW